MTLNLKPGEVSLIFCDPTEVNFEVLNEGLKHLKYDGQVMIIPYFKGDGKPFILMETIEEIEKWLVYIKGVLALKELSPS
jgi:hypothetical protein